MTNDQIVRTVTWVGDVATGFVRLIDQTRLPTEYVEIDCRDVPAVWEAIKSLRVRGAPAVGVAAGFGAGVGGRGRRGCWIWGGDWGTGAGHGRPGDDPPSVGRGHRIPSNQPSDGSQFVLGFGPNGCCRCGGDGIAQAQRRPRAFGPSPRRGPA